MECENLENSLKTEKLAEAGLAEKLLFTGLGGKRTDCDGTSRLNTEQIMATLTHQ